MVTHQNDASLLARATTSHPSLATETTTAFQPVLVAGNRVIPALNVNTGITLAIPAEKLVTSPRRAKANHKKFTRWKNQSLLRSVLMVKLIHFLLCCTIWTRIVMVLKYQSNWMELPSSWSYTWVLESLSSPMRHIQSISRTYPSVHPTLAHCTLHIHRIPSQGIWSAWCDPLYGYFGRNRRCITMIKP